MVIENVGNLVCAASSAAACSTAATTTPNLLTDDLARTNKVDLLEHVDFDLDVSPPRLDAVHPGWSKRL